VTDPFNTPPFVMGVPDSTGMGGLPTLGSSLPHTSSTLLPSGDISEMWPSGDFLKRLADK